MGAAAIPAAVAVGGSAFSAYESQQAGKASSSYYNYLSDTAKINADLSDVEAVSEKRQINAQLLDEETSITNRVSETVGAQKAAVVQGVGASSRSAQDIIKDTLDKGSLDEMALRLNADIKSNNADITAATNHMNFDLQGAGYRIAGGNARAAGSAAGAASLLQGAGSVANSWYMGKLYAGRQGATPVGKDK